MHIGTDIIQIDRMERALEKFGNKFAKKFLNNDEITLAKKIHTLAGFWAAKEAVSKALGCGIGADLSFHDIIIRKDHRGAPYFILSHRAKKIHTVQTSSLSISHDGGFAIAVAVVT